jgi:molybdate transport system substrate-binding protein
MLKNVIWFMAIFIFSFIITGCANQPSKTSLNDKESVELTISAAVSLKDSLEVIKKNFEDEHPNVAINFNFGSSGSLQQQIMQGAPVDLFFSAAEDKYQQLVDTGLIAKEDGMTLLANELVLITSKENPNQITNLMDLANKEIEHISIGIPDTVPAGKYAKESLENADLWADLESYIVYAKDVRQVLSYVETGNVAAGIVYHTDALTSNNVSIIQTIDSTTHTPILYPVGIVKDSNHVETAKEFLSYLQTNEAIEVFEDYGFIKE